MPSQASRSIVDLRNAGQSLWLDYIRRSLVLSGGLEELVDADGLSGVTSNPAIFEKAIDGSADYDEALRALLAHNAHAEPRALYDALSIEDVRAAADALRRTYEKSGGTDGFVSLEPPPQLASDTAGTLTEARRVWRAVDRPNLMVKVAATSEGIAAVEQLISEGINVNITLMFSMRHYEAVVGAYLRGLERSKDPARAASVASFFVSRIDTVVDRALDANGSPEALALRGEIAIANAKAVYQRFLEVFHGDAFAALRRRGAHPQRVLWASTSTKNPAYRDVLYVEELIGPETVNTIPPNALDAFRQHGRVRGATVLEDVPGALDELRRLAALGIDLDRIAQELQVEGVAAFAASYDQVLATLDKKRRAIVAGGLDRQALSLGPAQAAVDARLGAWQQSGFPRRLWARDPTLWAKEPLPELADRMGWLGLPDTMREQIGDLIAFADTVRTSGIRQVVLLGMGGSSLAPDVLAQTFPSPPGFPELMVLDSTHPAAVKAVEDRVSLEHTLFVVSSKSGTTTETLSLFRYFWQKADRAVAGPGRHFVAITDPGTPLEHLARDRAFLRVFSGPPDVGGRYSALSVFGLVPAALMGAPVADIVDRAWRMAEACAFCVPAAQNPGLQLGAALGELAKAGRDKVTFLAAPALTALPAWIEQLIAESTGKDGKGIVPVVGEPLGPPESYGNDRVFVHFSIGAADGELDRRVGAVAKAGHPVLRIQLGELADIGEEFFRWEVAVAAAGSVLGIHPFNQPDVQAAKGLARRAMASKSTAAGHGVLVTSQDDLSRALGSWLGAVRPGDYIGVQAYLAPSAGSTAALEALRSALRARKPAAVTLGYGPRYLHSTGQLHKGGPNTGVFLQITDEPALDLKVPETDYSFAELIRAQAQGDLEALRERGRRVLEVHLGADPGTRLDLLLDAVGRVEFHRSSGG